MMRNTTDQLKFSVILSIEAHAMAQKYSQGISNTAKKRQIYLNTLAVYAVNSYLQCLGFETNWQGSYSHDKLAVKLMNVADLEVKNLGKLECRPVLPTAQVCEIPPEVWSDRLCYIAVQLDSDLKKATILGFTQQPIAEVPLQELQSLEDLLLYLSKLEVANFEPSKTANIIKIGQWLDGFVDASWQTIEHLLNPQQLGLAFKNAVTMTRGQKIDLGMEINQICVILVLKVTTVKPNEIDILIQVYPLEKNVLPEGVKLNISDELETTVLQITSREGDNWIQVEFSAEIGEKFQAMVGYGEFQQTREFEV